MDLGFSLFSILKCVIICRLIIDSVSFVLFEILDTSSSENLYAHQIEEIMLKTRKSALFLG